MSVKMEEELNALPEDLKPVYKRIVLESQYHCVVRHGHPLVSYAVLSDLIKGGWRPTREPFLKKRSGKEFIFKE